MPVFLGKYQKYLGSMAREKNVTFVFQKARKLHLESLQVLFERAVPKQLDHSRHAQPS